LDGTKELALNENKCFLKYDSCFIKMICFLSFFGLSALDMLLKALTCSVDE